MKIDFSGEQLSDEQTSVFKQLINSGWTAEHIKRAVVNVKKFDKTGLRAKCSISIEASTDYGQIDVDAYHWNVETCLRKGIDKLDKQVRKRKGQVTDKKTKKSWRKGFWPRFRT